MTLNFESNPFNPYNDNMPRHWGFNCAGEIRPDFHVSPTSWPADPHAPKPKRKFVVGFAARWRRMALGLWPVDPHAPRMRPITDDLKEWRAAVEKVANEPWDPLIYGATMDSVIMDPTAAAFALDALADKIGVSDAVKAMQATVREHHWDIFMPKKVNTKLFTQEPGILKHSNLKKKDQIQALKLELGIAHSQIRKLTDTRNRLADQLSERIGQDLKNRHGDDQQKFQLMPGTCYPAQGIVVYAIHSDLGNVIAWHTTGFWWARHSLGSGPARLVTEANIKWYRKIS